MRFVSVLAMALLGATCVFAAGDAERTDAERMAVAVEQLRGAVGEWSVVTEFLDDDGSVAGSAPGTYSFEWVVEDRVVSGRSEMPDVKRNAGILFYVNEKKKTIEMVSVGADGQLWIMTGDAGDEVRYTQEFETASGKSQLRFRRYAVEQDRFESRMDWTADGGATWKPGNHQVFVRKKPAG